MSNLRKSISNWGRLPVALKFVWFVLAAGLVLLAWGYLNRIPSMGWTGLGLFVAGYAGGLLHGWGRKSGGPEATAFYIALLVSPLAGLFFCLLMVVVAGLFFAGVAIFGDFEWPQVVRILHFTGVLFCACVFISLPGTARRQKEHEEKVPEEAEEAG